MSKPSRRSPRTSQRVALARIADLEAALQTATGEEAAMLRARIWAVREIAGLPH